MNKLWGENAHGKLLVCVLEPGNVHRMLRNEPIEIRLNDGPYKDGLPAKLTVVLAYSETPIADASEFEQMLAVDAVKEDQRTPLNASRPHCPECRSTIEQLGVFRNDSPVWLVFCNTCGCTLGSMPPSAELRKK